jgi:antitoxin CcdA
MRIFFDFLPMPTRTIAPRRRKKAANLSVDDRLLDQAKRLKLNLSQVFESSLAEAIRERQGAEWLKKNRAAIDAYNEHVENDGVFSDRLRLF